MIKVRTPTTGKGLKTRGGIKVPVVEHHPLGGVWEIGQGKTNLDLIMPEGLSIEKRGGGSIRL